MGTSVASFKMVKGEDEDILERISLENPLKDRLADFIVFLNSPESEYLKDVVLISREKKEFPVHSLLLGLQSSLCRSLLINSPPGDDGSVMKRIILPDLDDSDLSSVVEFIYTGKVSTSEDVGHLLQIGSNYRGGTPAKKKGKNGLKNNRVGETFTYDDDIFNSNLSEKEGEDAVMESDSD